MMDLNNYFSEDLLRRFAELDQALIDSDFEGTDITSKEEIEKVKRGEHFSGQVNDYLDIQKKITSFLLTEAIERIDIENHFEVFLETSEFKGLPFNILVKGLEGKVMGGKPHSKYRPSDDVEDYIEQEIEEIENKVDLLS